MTLAALERTRRTPRGWCDELAGTTPAVEAIGRRRRYPASRRRAHSQSVGYCRRRGLVWLAVAAFGAACEVLGCGSACCRGAAPAGREAAESALRTLHSAFVGNKASRGARRARAEGGGGGGGPRLPPFLPSLCSSLLRALRQHVDQPEARKALPALREGGWRRRGPRGGPGRGNGSVRRCQGVTCQH